VIRFRKVRLTEAGLEMRANSPIELLLSDGVVEEFGGRGTVPARPKKSKAGKSGSSKASEAAPVQLTAADEALAARLKEWRAAEAKQLRVPAYIVLHDRTLTAIARAKPTNPRQLLDVEGMGPAKAERYGEAILKLCHL
jgi:ATP-dependent DNA helicase RecQ